MPMSGQAGGAALLHPIFVHPSPCAVHLQVLHSCLPVQPMGTFWPLESVHPPPVSGMQSSFPLLQVHFSPPSTVVSPWGTTPHGSSFLNHSQNLRKSHQASPISMSSISMDSESSSKSPPSINMS